MVRFILKRWVNNGVENRIIDKKGEVPVGFNNGMIHSSWLLSKIVN